MLDKRLDSIWFSGAQDDSLNVVSQEDQDEYHPGNSQRWTMHIKASMGTLDRLARVLRSQGARADWDRFPNGWEPITADDSPPDSERTQRADYELDQAKDRQSEQRA